MLDLVGFLVLKYCVISAPDSVACDIGHVSIANGIVENENMCSMQLYLSGFREHIQRHHTPYYFTGWGGASSWEESA